MGRIKIAWHLRHQADVSGKSGEMTVHETNMALGQKKDVF